jgi:hypothetical protein
MRSLLCFLLLFLLTSAPSISARADGAALEGLAEALEQPLGRWLLATDQGKLISLYVGAPEADAAAVLRSLRDPSLDGFSRDLGERVSSIRSRLSRAAESDAEVAEFLRSGTLTQRVARLFRQLVAEELSVAWGSMGELKFVARETAAKSYAAARAALVAPGMAAATSRDAAIVALRAGRVAAGTDLSGVDLTGDVFPDGVQAAGAKFKGANLREIRMKKCRFDGANLDGAKLVDGIFEEARFDKASLRGVDLSGADVAGASFKKADLRGADLRSVRMDNSTDFSGAIVDDTTRLPFDRSYAKGYGFDFR